MTSRIFLSTHGGRSTLRRESGLTLVELMVAMVLGLLVTAAAVAALMIARRGFNTVDSGSQLRENVRFASSLIERIAVQAGFYDVAQGTGPDVYTANPRPVEGYDNALVAIGSASTTPPTYTATSGINGSDVLVVRYVGASRPNQPGASADGSMINCAGIAEPQKLVTDSNPFATSVFHITTSTSGEPTLACTYADPATGVWATLPLVQGVESLQILYGVDTLGSDAIADRYLRASQIASADWPHVRSIRVGMVVRGPVNSAVDSAGTAQSLNVLGAGFTSASDVGSVLTVAAAGGRLRQQLVFTVHLRNPQDPGVAP